MRLSDVMVGSTAIVEGFSDETPLDSAARFRALGFLQGAVVGVQRALPFGGPLVVSIGGGAFALERSASTFIQVTMSESF